MRIPVLGLVIVFTALSASAGAQDTDNRLTLDLYLEYESVSDPRLSPDGQRVIYSRQWIDKVNDRRESSLWIMEVDGSRNRFLVEGSGARWSPGGDRIAFVAEGEPKGSQVFVRWMDAEGATTQITRVERGPGSLSWSPDGELIAFTMTVQEPNTWPIDIPEAPEGATWTKAPRVIERLDYRQDRQGFTDDLSRHLFVVPASGGTARQLTNGSWDHTGTAWTPDGRSLLFSSLRVDDADYQWRESEIYAVDLASGDIRALTTRRGPDQAPVVSPDGQQVAYTGYDWTRDTYITRKVYLMNIDGSNPRLASGAWDRQPSNLVWKPDGSGLYISSRTEGTGNLYFLPTTGPSAGTVRPITQGQHLLTVSDLSDDGTAVGVRTSFYAPPDVVTFAVGTPTAITQLTAVNDDILTGKVLGTVEEIWYPSTDGLQVQGWYITPPDFDSSRDYPMQLHIHGGPHGMYGVGFNFGWQWQAAQDYVILYTNPRGSAGYGSAFGNEIMNAYPSKDYDDLMAGVDVLLDKGFVDSQNLFVTGCSGGGVLTAWVVGHTDRFAAASSNCPVIDWVSFVGTTDGATWYQNFQELPWDDPSEHLRRSPLTYVGNVTTPTMLMTGVNDLRTPMPQTEQFYSALKLLKVPTAMVRFNNEWHGTSRTPSNFLRTQAYLKHWFERYSRPSTTHTEQPQQP